MDGAAGDTEWARTRSTQPATTALRPAEFRLLSAIRPALPDSGALAPASPQAAADLRAAGYQPVRDLAEGAAPECGALAWLGDAPVDIADVQALGCAVTAVRLEAAEAAELVADARDLGLTSFGWLTSPNGLDFVEWNAIEPSGAPKGTLVLVHGDVADTVAAVVAGLRRDWHRELGERLHAIEETLPSLHGSHERAIRDELELEKGPDDGVVLRLEQQLQILAIERAHLYRDRRSSLRAWAWRPWGRARHWIRPRLGTLVQHAPEPLVVPRRYTATRSPRPTPSISIVTPSLDQGEFLERTLLSVTTQRYPALEYVVQDGGSRDGTVAVLQRHERDLSRWRSGPDGGQGAAINQGFRDTTGQIMAYLNADDVLLPGALAYVGRFFARHPEVDVVYGHRILIDAQDRRVGIWVVPPHRDEMLRWTDCVPQETLFWRRELWDSVGGIDERFGFALDWDLLLRFRSAGATFRRLPRFLGAFRVHSTQKTTRLAATGRDEIERLLAREHGRTVDRTEAYERVRPYLRRHIAWHTAYRIGARLPARRTSPSYLTG